jgi:16S rRNA (guanine527-N7)-methyltransferase
MDELIWAAEAMAVDLDAIALGRLEQLLQLLQDGNRLFNLSGLHEIETIVRRHLIESIALGKVLVDHQLLQGTPALLDLGSGAGFPGLPLKVVWPEIQLTCLEATGKKAGFIETAAAALQLPEIRVLTGRAETLGHEPWLRESQDVVVARAVAPLPALAELALPLLRLGGTLGAVKGSRWNEELEAADAALKICGGAFAERVALHGSEELGIVFVTKCALTPPQYPRRPGQPAAHPLRRR